LPLYYYFGVPSKILDRLIYASVEPIVDLTWRSTIDQVILLTQDIESSFLAKEAGAVFDNLTVTCGTVWSYGLTCKLL